MTDAARVLLTAAILSAAALAAFAWRLTRLDRASPDRLIGELRLAQGLIVLLAATGGVNLGAAIVLRADPAAGLELALGVAFVVGAAALLTREPREALTLLAAAFVLHALVDIAHRPGWLPVTLDSRAYAAGGAIYDTVIAALCFFARRG